MTKATEISEMSSSDMKEAGILGRMTPEENQRVLEYKTRDQDFTAELGRMSIRLSRMEAQVEQVRRQQRQTIAQYDSLEAEANRFLDEIGQRFGIKPGEPWQTLPDGSVRRIDPALLQQAQEAQRAARAAARAAAQSTKEDQQGTDPQ